MSRDALRRVTIAEPSVDATNFSFDASSVVSTASSPNVPAVRFRPPDLLAQITQEEFKTLAERFHNKSISKLDLLESLLPCLLPKYDLPVDELEDQLNDMFKVVNTYGSEEITWEEFTNYLIDAAMHGRPNVDSHDNILEYHAVKEVELYTGVEDAIRKALTLRGLRSVLGCLRSKKLKLFDPTANCKVTHEITLPRGAFALHAEYLPPYKGLLVSTSDLKFSVFSQAPTVSREWVQRWECSLEASQTCVRWAPHRRRVYSGSRTGEILVWQLLGDRGKKDFELGLEASVVAHCDSIMDLLLFQDDSRLASCALDGSVALRDLYRGLQAVYENKGNCKGLHSLAHNQDYRVIAAAGYEYHPFVWLDSQLNLPPLQLHDTTSPHSASLIGVAAVPHSPQLISCDAKGVCKIWDLRKMLPVQSFQVPEHGRRDADATMHSFCYVGATKQLIFNGAKTYIYEYDGRAQTEPRLSHDSVSVLVQALFNPQENAFFTCAGKGVKCWDASTGFAETFFKRLVDSEITSACLDESGRKFVVGTQDGQVLTRHFATGQAVGHYVRSAHDGEITTVLYCRGLHYLVSTSETGWLTIWTDIDSQTKGNRSVPLKAIEMAYRPTCTAYSLELSLLLVGDTNHTVHCFLLDDKSRDGALPLVHKCEKNEGEIVALELLAPYPAFVCSDGGGCLSIWTVRPYPYRDVRLARWENFKSYTSSLSKFRGRVVSYVPAVTAIAWYPPHTLFTGDEAGQVAHWSLAEVVSDCHLSEASMRDITIEIAAKPAFPRPRMRDKVRCVKSWQAHSRETIITLQFIAPHYLLTAAYDNYVFLWNVSGPKASCCACLEQGRGLNPAKATPWDFWPSSRHDRQSSILQDFTLGDRWDECVTQRRMSLGSSVSLPSTEPPAINVTSTGLQLEGNSSRRRRMLPAVGLHVSASVVGDAQSVRSSERSVTDSTRTGASSSMDQKARGESNSDSDGSSDLVSDDFSASHASRRVGPKFKNFRMRKNPGNIQLQAQLHSTTPERPQPLHQAILPQAAHAPPATLRSEVPQTQPVANTRATEKHQDDRDFGDGQLARVSTLFDLLMVEHRSFAAKSSILMEKPPPLNRKQTDLQQLVLRRNAGTVPSTSELPSGLVDSPGDPRLAPSGERKVSHRRRGGRHSMLDEQLFDRAVSAARELTTTSALLGMSDRLSVIAETDSTTASPPRQRPSRPLSATPATGRASDSASTASGISSVPSSTRPASALTGRKRYRLTGVRTGFACKSALTQQARVASTTPGGIPLVVPGKGDAEIAFSKLPKRVEQSDKSAEHAAKMEELQQWLLGSDAVTKPTRQQFLAPRIEATRSAEPR
eukprot:TRINITY_DN1417_c0_g1_i1.p1 TRINITY_DN1417_c0_g1~~TRINITY_DN1417_c0_g1_i1.p1  ORF type:complete len:1340 (-),score=125.85 TRINITY_DN1417_c0_g1_i1:622-4641(-)